MHGRDPELPGENQINPIMAGAPLPQFITQLLQKLKEAWTQAAKHAFRAQNQYKTQFDKKAKRRIFQVGDLVVMKNREKLSKSRVSNKFHPEFERLFRVIDVTGSDLLLAKVGDATREPKRYNAAIVKHFNGAEEDYMCYERRLRGDNTNQPGPRRDVDLKCGECSGSYNEDLHAQIGGRVQWKECDYCLEWYHFECVGLTDEPAQSIWHCPHCTKRITEDSENEHEIEY